MNGSEKRRAAIRQRGFQGFDGLLEAGGVDFAALQNLICERANHFARPGAGEGRFARGIAQQRGGVIAEDEIKQAGQGFAVESVRAEKLRGAIEPGSRVPSSGHLRFPRLSRASRARAGFPRRQMRQRD